MDASQIRQKIGVIKRDREQIERMALQPIAMINGYWVIRYIKCGKAGCKCGSGKERHGPYYYISRTQKGKTRLEYVDRERFKKEEMCKKWSQYSGWIARMVKYNRQIEGLYRRLAKAQVKRSK